MINFSFFISFSEISDSKKFFKFLGIFPSTIPVTADKASVVFSNFLKAFNLTLTKKKGGINICQMSKKSKKKILTLGWHFRQFRNPCRSHQASPSCHHQQAWIKHNQQQSRKEQAFFFILQLRRVEKKRESLKRKFFFGKIQGVKKLFFFQHWVVTMKGHVVRISPQGNKPFRWKTVNITLTGLFEI